MKDFDRTTVFSISEHSEIWCYLIGTAQRICDYRNFQSSHYMSHLLTSVCLYIVILQNKEKVLLSSIILWILSWVHKDFFAFIHLWIFISTPSSNATDQSLCSHLPNKNSDDTTIKVAKHIKFRKVFLFVPYLIIQQCVQFCLNFLSVSFLCDSIE